jgi:hypothetical protein
VRRFGPDQPATDEPAQPDGAQATKRFDVYRNVAVSLTDALETRVSVVAKLVGTDFFSARWQVFALAEILFCRRR